MIKRVSGRATWALVIVAAIMLRLAALWIAWDRSQTGDSHSYLVLADQLLAGHGLTLLDPFMGVEVRAIYPPVMPILLAGIGALVPLSLPTIALINLAIDALAALLIRRLGTDGNAPVAGSLAAALYLLLPANIALTPIVHKEGLLNLFVAAMAILLIRLARGGGARDAIAFGLVAGLTALTQPALASLPMLFALFLLPMFDSRRAWVRAMLVAAGVAVLVMVPWWVRNFLLFDRFVPLTTSGGASFLIGASPASGGLYAPPPDHVRGLGELDASVEMAREALAIIAADPLAFAGRAAVKLWRASTLDNWAASKLMWMQPVAYRGIAVAWGALATAVHLALLALAAVTLARNRRRTPLNLLMLAALAQIMLFGPWFEFGQRHRYFLAPMLVLLAAQAVLAFPSLVSRYKRRRWFATHTS